MATATNFVNATKSDVGNLLDLIEQAQAIAAARTQETTALGGGAAATSGYDWNGAAFTEQQFYDCLTSLAALADVLGAHKTNLYRVKE